MSARLVLLACLSFILLLGGLTVYVVVDTGEFGPLEAGSLLVLGLFAAGLVGAIRQPPE